MTDTTEPFQHHADVELELERLGDARVVRLAGDLTRHEAIRLRETLFNLDEEPSPVVFDLAHVGFVSASGIGLLVELHRYLNLTGCGLSLANVQPDVADLLRLTHVDAILPVWRTVDEALAADLVAA